MSTAAFTDRATMPTSPDIALPAPLSAIEEEVSRRQQS